MDGELLRWLYHRLLGDPNTSRTRDCTYSDGLIALIYFFAALTHHSPRWACQKRNWPPWCRRRAFPSYSQLCRRLKNAQIERLIEQINSECKAHLPRGDELIVDGKPLVVGGFSKDPDATTGRVPDGYARGYRLNVVGSSAGVYEAFEVTGLNGGEATVIRELISDVELEGRIVRGDANFDSNPLYRVIAEAGARLIAERRKPGRGLGHCPHHPHRLQAIKELEQTLHGLAQHRRRRIRIEQSFAHLTNLSFGLCGLPNFVRRLPRVRRWVLAKITLYHLHRMLLQEVACAA